MPASLIAVAIIAVAVATPTMDYDAATQMTDNDADDDAATQTTGDDADDGRRSRKHRCRDADDKVTRQPAINEAREAMAR